MYYVDLLMKNLQNLFPRTNSEDYEKMPDDLKELYIVLNCQYRDLFIDYFIRKLDLKEYDDKIKNSKFNYKKLERKNMDIYQATCADKLDYFYVRNNFYIERLDEIEKSFVYNCIGNKLNTPDLIKDRFIERTFRKVIFEDVMHNGEVCTTNYGPESPRYYAYNNSLVIGVRHDEFNEAELSEEDEIEKMKFFLNICKEIEMNISEKIQTPVNVIKYNDFSIKPVIMPDLPLSLK